MSYVDSLKSDTYPFTLQGQNEGCNFTHRELYKDILTKLEGTLTCRHPHILAYALVEIQNSSGCSPSVKDSIICADVKGCNQTYPSANLGVSLRSGCQLCSRTNFESVSVIPSLNFARRNPEFARRSRMKLDWLPPASRDPHSSAEL